MSLPRVAVQDQGSTPSCYAYTAASMVQTYAETKLQAPTSVSGPGLYDLVLGTESWVKNVNTGRTCNAIRLAKLKHGQFGAALAELPECLTYDFQPASESKQELRTPSEFLAKLHALLDAGGPGLPVGIEYCAGVLSADGALIHNRSFRKDLNYLATSEASENFASQCGFHASFVVGRERKADGRCHLLVQNSWGTGCYSYPSDIRPCESGRIWVPEDELAKNLVRLSYFQ